MALKWLYDVFQSFLRYFVSKPTNMSNLGVRFKSRVAQGALDRDKARAQKLLAGLHPHGPSAFYSRQTKPTIVQPGDSINVIDSGVTYTLPVGFGTPAQNYNLLIDTGSSNTRVGAGQKYKVTPSCRNTGNSVNVAYGSGQFSGAEYIDTITLGPNLVIPEQSIGVASTSKGLDDGVDGILGIGPVDLTAGTVPGASSVPTVADNLYKLGIIPTESIGISYVPSTRAQDTANGELTFGIVDTTKYTGEIEYVPITKTSPASKYWGIDQTITYGNGTPIPILAQTAGVVDSGTTLLLLATNAFQAYQQATGAVMDNTTGLLTVTQQQFEKLECLNFKIGNATFKLTPNAQIWPRALNSVLGGNPSTIYLVTGDLGNNSGTGLDFINGFAFLQRFYSVYDTTNNRVGIATTTYTNAETN